MEIFRYVTSRLSAEVGLSENDVNLLAEHNFGSYFATICAHYFANPDFHNNLKSMCKYLMEERHDVLSSHNFEAVLEGFQELERMGREVRLDYDKVYDWPSDSKLKRRHKELMSRLQEWPRDAPGQPCDIVCATINVVVRMLNTVGLPSGQLVERQRIEQLQEEFVQMLYRYLFFVHGSAGRAGSRLANSITDGLLAREAYDVHRRILDKEQAHLQELDDQQQP